MSQVSSSTTFDAPPKVGMVSLGCPKALVDSERILTKLRADGYQFSPNYTDADVVLVNTCGFLDSAREESLAAIDEAIQQNGQVIVTGCMGKDAQTIRKHFPNILAITGPHQYEDVVNAVHQAAPPPQNPYIDLIPKGGLKLTPRHYSYLKIAEGCNNRCQFCIIPQLRGKLNSRRIDAVLREAEKLLAAGTKELLIISQDTSAYGLDTAYTTRLWHGHTIRTHLTNLAIELGQMRTLDGTPPWVRLHYVYPYPHVDKLIPLMAEGLLTPYLDIPFQHASPPLLKAMRRPAASARTLDRLREWRTICPTLAIRSSFIVGYPGESDDDFAYLLDWLDEAQIDRVGAFRFEAVQGAAASALPNQIPEEIKEQRYQQLMQKCAAISSAKLAHKIGTAIPVIIDEVDDINETNRGASGRSQGDAPDIDGAVHLRDVPPSLKVGDIISAHIEDADTHDLYGVPL